VAIAYIIHTKIMKKDYSQKQIDTQISSTIYLLSHQKQRLTVFNPSA